MNMVKSVDYSVCINCKLCESICMADVFMFNKKTGKVEIRYPDDCYNCFECYSICPVDALSFVPEMSKKFNTRNRWNQIKNAILSENAENGSN